MNDLDLVTDLAPQVPLPEPSDLAGARRRLVAAIAAEHTGARPHMRRPGRSWRGQSVRRLALAAAVGAAAAAAAALVVVPGHSPSAPARAAGGPPTGVKLAAAPFFRRAAKVAGRQPVAIPGPDQYVYTETSPAGGRQWLSAEGNKAGLVENAGQRSFRSPPCTVAQALATHCYEQAGYLPSMPTDPHRLLAYLVKVGIADAPPGPRSTLGVGWEANDLGKSVDYLMQTTYLLPAQQAALFKLMAQTPGFTVVAGQRDAIGRTGVAVRWTYEGAPAEIIFNPVSYAYMGDRTWSAPSFHGPGADAYHGAALVRMAFVNKAGELP